MVSRSSARPRDSASTKASSSGANSSKASGIRCPPSGAQSGAGRRWINSAIAASFRAHACASTRSQADSTPISSSSEEPSYRSSPRRPGPRTPPAPGSPPPHPAPARIRTPLPGWTTRPGRPAPTRAGPGPDGLADAASTASAPVVPAVPRQRPPGLALHSLGDARQLRRRQRILTWRRWAFGVPPLLRVKRLVLPGGGLAPGQPLLLVIGSGVGTGSQRRARREPQSRPGPGRAGSGDMHTTRSEE